jgi:hypothetical protein
MPTYLILALLFLFFFTCYAASEYYRYKTARMLAEGLGGRAVFKISRSFMRRDHDGVEERAWIVPDDRMAWGSILSALSPPAGILYLRRERGPDFRFHIEPKTGVLLRTVALGNLKAADFNAAGLDEKLRLRTHNRTEAARYFAAPEKQQALIALFRAGFTQLKGDYDGIVATMKGISAEDLNPEKIGLYFGHLRAL